MEAKRDNPLYKYKPTSFYNHGPILPNVQEISKRYKACFYIINGQMTKIRLN